MSKHTTRHDHRPHTFREPKQPGAKNVVIPAHIKVKVCPSGTDQRFSADPGHVGEFSRAGIGRYETDTGPDTEGIGFCDE